MLVSLAQDGSPHRISLSLPSATANSEVPTYRKCNCRVAKLHRVFSRDNLVVRILLDQLTILNKHYTKPITTYDPPKCSPSSPPLPKKPSHQTSSPAPSNTTAPSTHHNATGTPPPNKTKPAHPSSEDESYVERNFPSQKATKAQYCKRRTRKSSGNLRFLYPERMAWTMMRMSRRRRLRL